LLLQLFNQLPRNELQALTPQDLGVIGAYIRGEAVQLRIESAQIGVEISLDKIDVLTILSLALGLVGYLGSALDIYLAGGATGLGWAMLLLSLVTLIFAAWQEQNRLRRSIDRE
jgi:hypothetical protein